MDASCTKIKNLSCYSKLIRCYTTKTPLKRVIFDGRLVLRLVSIMSVLSIYAVSRFSFLGGSVTAASDFKFLVSSSSFLVPRSSFLVPRSSFLVPRYLSRVLGVLLSQSLRPLSCVSPGGQLSYLSRVLGVLSSQTAQLCLTWRSAELSEPCARSALVSDRSAVSHLAVS